MKLMILHIILFFFVLNYNSEFNTKNSERTNFYKHNLLFHSKMGPQNLKMEVFVYSLETKINKRKILVQLNKENKILFSDTLLIKMDEEPIIELRKINGDKIEDLVIEYLRPGRGGNNGSMIYIFDENEIRLTKISNSIEFPNLIFDENLGFISSFRFYGGDGVQMDFLEIKNDTLLPKYEVIKEVKKIYLKKLEKGNWIDIGEKTIDKNIIIPEIIQLEPEIKIKNAS